MDIYYSFDEIRSHQCMLNYVLSNRGSGKTFGAKVMCIKDFIKSNGEQQFMYVRRFASELEDKDMFFNDIIESNLFPDYEFTVKGNIGYCNGEIICHFVPLSTSLQKKSVPYPKVTKIIYDEFIINRNTQRYLKNEVIIFLELISTVVRNRDNVTVFCLGNNLSYVNPHFSYFGITVDGNKRFTKSNNKQIVVEIYNNKNFAKAQKKTTFGKIIKDTKYGKYNIENANLQDSDCFIVPKMPYKKIFYCSFLLNSKEYGVWYVEDYKTYYVDDKINNTSKKRYSVNLDEHKEGYINIKFARMDFRIRNFKNLFAKGLIVFKSQEIKINFYEILKYL